MCFKHLNIAQFIVIISLFFKPFSLCSEAVSDSRDRPKIDMPCLFRNTILLNLDYFSDAQYFGLSNTSSFRQPVAASGVSFYSRKQFDLSLQSVCAWNSDTTFTKKAFEFDFAGGYTFNISRKLSVRPSYSRIVYSRNNNELRKAFSDILQTDVYYFTDHYFAGSSFNYMIGNKNMFFFTLQNAAYFNIDKIFGKKTCLNLQFEADISVNNKNFYNSIIYELWDAEEFTAWIDENFTQYSEKIREDISLYGLETLKDRISTIFERDGYTIFDPSYTITSIQVYTPVMLALSRFTINFTPLINIPCYKSQFYEQYISFIFTAGCSISFNL